MNARYATTRSAMAIAALFTAACCAAALAHSEPRPVRVPGPTAPVRQQEALTTRIVPPRWSWLHWWEANRDRYLVSPSQDGALQAPNPAQLAALREDAARELIKAIEGPGRDVVATEAALALGKMRRAQALPLLKNLSTGGDTIPVRRAALLGMGLLASADAERELVAFNSKQHLERVGALAALGLLDDVDAATLRSLRAAVAVSRARLREPADNRERERPLTPRDERERAEQQAISTVVCWVLRQHAKDDSLEYFRNLLATNESPWIASEALLGLGGTKNHAAQRLLEDALHGSAGQRIVAWDALEQIQKEKLKFASARERQVGTYDAEYELYLQQHALFWGNSPNAMKPMEKQERLKPVHLELGHEEISMGWIRASAAIALGQLDAPRAGDTLLRFIKQDSTKNENQYLVVPMSFAIMSLTAYPSEGSRDRCIALLGKQDERGKLILDVPKDSPLRGFAALALGLYARPYDTAQGPADLVGFDRAIVTLAERLEDDREQEEVRTACALALGLAQRTVVLPVMHRLAARLEQRNRRVDSPVLGFVLLGRSLAGDRSVIEPAARFLLDREDDASTSGIVGRRAAVLSLGVTRSATAIPVLTRAWHLNYHVNREVILALRLVGAASAAGPVMERLRNPKNDLERAYMAHALGELLAHERPTAMSRLMAGSNYTVRNENMRPLQTLANEFLFDHLVASFGEDW